MIEYSAYSDKGLICEENQDSVFCRCDGDKGIFLVADGMGGHEDGARASSTITAYAKEWWESGCFREESFTETVSSLKQLLADANYEIFDNTPEGSLCGSTAVLLWIDGDGYALLTSGDSRCYKITSQTEDGDVNIEVISTDDIWENNVNNTWGMSEDEIRSHPNYGKLIRAVGAKEDFSCTVSCDSIDCPSTFVICSDGIYKYADEQVLYSTMENAALTGDLDECCRRLKDDVYEGGAPDNLSVIMLRAGRHHTMKLRHTVCMDTVL